MNKITDYLMDSTNSDSEIELIYKLLASGLLVLLSPILIPVCLLGLIGLFFFKSSERILP